MSLLPIRLGQIALLATSFVFGACENNDRRQNEVIKSAPRTIPQINPDLVAVDHPFGLIWSSTEIELEALSAILTDSCKESLARNNAWRGVGDEEEFLRTCLADDYFYIPDKYVEDYFKDGSVTMYLDRNAKPKGFGFSYLHRFHPSLEEANQRARRSAPIQQALEVLYGPPLKSGHFDQNTREGFVPTDEAEPTCHYWQSKDVEVLLCSERVIMEDGFEMSLEYARSD